MAHVGCYVCYGDGLGICGDVGCVPGVVGFITRDVVKCKVCLCSGCDGCFFV